MSNQSFGPRLQSLLSSFLLLLIFGYLGYEGVNYYLQQNYFARGTIIGDLDMTGLSAEQASEKLSYYYLSPIILYDGDNEVQIMPHEVGFTIDIPQMIAIAQAQQTNTEWWEGYLNYLFKQTDTYEPVPLIASHNPDALAERIETIARYLDNPATPPRPAGESRIFQAGTPGQLVNRTTTIDNATPLLYQPHDRQAPIHIEDQPAPPFNLEETLYRAIENELLGFDGFASIVIIDLQTGEELSINGDVAISGLSVIKIAIMLETYRAIENATFDQQKLLTETAVNSGNYSANLLLDVVAGQDNAYLGSDILTNSMHRLGLKNTFIAVPYEEPARAGRETYATPANTRTDINLYPDPAMQTTAEDMASLLAMIYQCAKGGGALMAVYPDQFTPDECQNLIDLMAQNVEGNLIRFGVPENAVVSHKHGWAQATHGDAGIVYSPGGDYIIVEYLHQPGDWLVSEVSFPILRQISRVTYNYFNHDDPFIEEHAILEELLRQEQEALQQEQDALQ
ncbi:MAG TPA: serine hydrolase [Anaerolineae bacterium]|nr:serine hydrolase [Anaerolineae bacterium]